MTAAEETWLTADGPEKMVCSFGVTGGQEPLLYIVAETYALPDSPDGVKIPARRIRAWVEGCREEEFRLNPGTPFPYPGHDLDDPFGLGLAFQNWREAPISAGCPPTVWRADALREVVGNPFRPVRCKVTGNPLGTDTVMVRADGTFAGCDCAALNPQVLSLALAARENRLGDGTLDPVRLRVLANALLDAGYPEEEKCPACGGAKGEWVLDQGWRDKWAHCLPCRGCGRIPSRLLGHLRSPGPHLYGCWALDLVLAF